MPGNKRSRVYSALFNVKPVPLPTRLGWVSIFLLAPLLIGLVIVNAESFLAVNESTASGTLIVECWIGKPGLEAASKEFLAKNYCHLVLVGGIVESKWGTDTWNYTEFAKELVRKAQPEIPEEKILTVTNDFMIRNRTHSSAIAVFSSLQRKGLAIDNINVVTEGAHARRSWLVYSRVFNEIDEVGVISWQPLPRYQGKWYNSSERAKLVLTEYIGYLYEKLLYSGRIWNST